MKVRDLKALLDNYPEGADVFLSADAEGNEFSEVEDAEMSYFSRSELTHGRMEVLYTSEDLDYMEEDERSDMAPAVVLWPI